MGRLFYKVAAFGSGMLLCRLRCPAETSPGGAGSFLADRCTRCAFASSAPGGAKARGQICLHFCPRAKIKEDIPASFLRHYPAHKNGQLNISELARVCDISRTTAYKYIGLLEA